MAFLPSWAWVLVACVSAALAGAPSLSDLYPPLWKQSPGQFLMYKVENGKYIINPWVFTERMGMYKILLKQTATYFAKFAPENEQNILWGLPLQHGWQYSSGRLADPRRRTNCGYESDRLCISIDSWWADMNYFLSVLPFLAALDSGIMEISPDEVTLLPPLKDQMRFCYDVSGCHSSFPEIMSKWRAFFQYMQTPSRTFEYLLKYLWDAHTTSLKDTTKSFEDSFSVLELDITWGGNDSKKELASGKKYGVIGVKNGPSFRFTTVIGDLYAYYSQEEVNFGKNWVVAVHYLAASRLPTTLIRSHTFQKGLPPRVLTSTDIAPFISNFTDLQNTVLVALNIIGDMNRDTGSLTLAAWKVLMMTQAARERFLEFFEMVFESFP
ncbi:protein LEG1 homolog [Erethizon dorsatum]